MAWLWWTLGSVAGLVVLLGVVLVVRLALLSPQDRAFLGARPWLAALVKRRLNGYREVIVEPDPAAPNKPATPRRVAVIGAGLAGIGAASALAERGFTVSLIDRNAYLGGKVGAWDQVLDDGSTVAVEHGFHAFFRHYLNLDTFLRRLGVHRSYKTIEDYLILDKELQEIGFRGIETTPVLNLFALARHGIFRWRDILFGPALHHMDVFLTWDPQHTPAELDTTSFATFADRARLPDRLRLTFNTFSRAFFAEEDRLSMAELVKSFHFYYLSHDGGLIYDYPGDDYQRTLLRPIARHLNEAGVEVLLGTGVDSLVADDGGWRVNGVRYDYVVCAAHVVGTRRLVAASRDVQDAVPDLLGRLQRLQPTQRYAVLRLWIDGTVRDDLPPYVITDRLVLLDAVASYHRIEQASADYVARHGGVVIELHSYAVPDELPDDAAIRDQLVTELHHFFPELAGAPIRNEVLQVRQDFAAFPPGVWHLRPGVVTAAPSLLLAGDWVRLPFPAMLMEAAFSSGLMAANAILEREGVRQVPVASVPLRGILPPRPGKKRP